MRNDFYIGKAGDLQPAITYGLRMGAGFLDALQAPPELKDFVTSESRVGHGKRILSSLRRVKSREMSLTMRMCADSVEQLSAFRNAFYALLQEGEIDLCVPDESSDIYHLVYLGKSSSHTYSLDRTSCSITTRFMESNPNERGTYLSPSLPTVDTNGIGGEGSIDGE